eukprot:11202684-Lingulodinium_polyedra.AAC.1
MVESARRQGKAMGPAHCPAEPGVFLERSVGEDWIQQRRAAGARDPAARELPAGAGAKHLVIRDRDGSDE